MKNTISTIYNYLTGYTGTIKNDTELLKFVKTNITEENIDELSYDKIIVIKDVIYVLEQLGFQEKRRTIEYLANLLATAGIKAIKLKETLLNGILLISHFDYTEKEVLIKNKDFIEERKQIFIRVLDVMWVNDCSFDHVYEVEHDEYLDYPLNLVFRYHYYVNKNVTLDFIIKNNKNIIASKIVEKCDIIMNKKEVIEEGLTKSDNKFRINYLFTLLTEIGYAKNLIFQEGKKEAFLSYLELLIDSYNYIIKNIDNINKKKIKYYLINEISLEEVEKMILW